MTLDAKRSPRPRKLGARLKHYWLAQRMAKRTGVDLKEAFETGALPQEDWADLVTRCQACNWTEGCGRFLSTTEEGPLPIPPGCENRATLLKLKTEQRT